MSGCAYCAFLGQVLDVALILGALLGLGYAAVVVLAIGQWAWQRLRGDSGGL